MQTNVQLLTHLAHFFLAAEMFQTKVVDKIKTHILYSITFSEHRIVCKREREWKNILESDSAHMTIWRRMIITCWITKATNIHS
jgi:hypothetical protein